MYDNTKLNPVSPYSSKFFKINDKLKQLKEEVNASKNKREKIKDEEIKKRYNDIIISEGVNPVEYSKSIKEFRKITGDVPESEGRDIIMAEWGGEQKGFLPDIPGSQLIARLGGRLVENIGDTVAFAGTAVEYGIRPDKSFDEIYERNQKAFDTIADKIPNGYRKLFQKYFDPYHGDGFVEPIAADILSIASVGKMGKEATKKLAPSFKQTKSFEGPTRAYIEKLFKSKLGKFTAGSIGAAGLWAAMDDASPEYGESLFIDTAPEFLGDVYNAVMDNPEAKKASEELQRNPNNSAAEGYLNNFIDALGFTAIGGAFIKSLKEGVKQVPTGQIKKAAEGIKRLEILPPSWRVNLSSRAGTDNQSLDLLTRRTNFGAALSMQLEGRARDLKNLVNKGTKKGEQRNKVKRIINDVWMTSPKDSAYNNLLRQLPDDIATLVKEMDGEFRNLSKMTGLTKGKLKARIGKTGDSYVTRDYEFFDYGKYQKKVVDSFKSFYSAFKNGDAAAMRASDPDGFFASLVDVLGKNSGRSSQAALNDLSKIIQKSGTDKSTFNIFKGILQQDSRIADQYVGKQRKKLPASIREVLGEIKDPYRNYITTMSNISTAFAESDFLEDIAKVMLKNQKAIQGKGREAEAVSKGLVSLEEVAEQRLGQIFGRGSVSQGQVKNPFKDVYATPEYKKFIEEGLDVTRPDGFLMRTLLKGRGLLTTGATVASTATMGVNVMGNALLMIANGMLPIGKGLGKASKVGVSQMFGQNNFVSKMLGMSNKELGDFVAKYQGLGLLGQSVKGNILKKQLQSIADNPKLFDELLSNPTSVTQTAEDVIKLPVRGAVSLSQLGFKKLTDFYQLQDDLFKMMHFEKTMNYMGKSKTYRDLDLPNLEIAAAQRTRDLLPNYSMIPKAVKKVSSGPFFGEFAAFPAESTRIVKNLFTYTANDLASGDPALMAAGAKRLAGINALAITPYAMQQYSRELAGITKEEEDAFERSVVSDFDYMSPRIYTSGIETIKTGKGGQQERQVLDYFNFGRIDPTSYLKRPAAMFNALLQDGTYSEDQMNKALFATASEILSPYIAPSMLTDAFGKFYKQSSEMDDAPFSQQIPAYLGLAGDIFNIGTLRYVDNAEDYYAQKEKYGEDIRPVKEYGIAYAEDEFSFPAFIGLKQSSADFSGSVKFNVDQPLKDWQRSNKNIQDYLKKNARVIQDTPEYIQEIQSKANDSIERGLENQRKFSAVVDDYETIFKNRVEGGGEQVILDGYQAGGYKNAPKEFENLLKFSRQNRFRPVKLRPSDEEIFLQGIPFKIEKILDDMEINSDRIRLFDGE